MVIDAMDLLYSGRFDGFCIVSSDSDFTRLAARIRESGLTVYGFGERKTPKPFVAACDKFIYIENLAYVQDAATAADEALKPTPRASTTQLKRDAALVNQLRNAVEAGSDDDGWTLPASVGHIITQQSPDFDSRNYGYAKLSDLMAATTLFELDRRSPGDGKPEIIYARQAPPPEQEIQVRASRYLRAPRAGRRGRRRGRDTPAVSPLRSPRRYCPTSARYDRSARWIGPRPRSRRRCRR
jgi:uncharacterized LabA/DUF88 family protein